MKMARYFLRRAAVRRQKSRCWWCLVVMRKSGRGAPTCATLEHLIPAWLGGDDTEENTGAACERCNRARGASMSPPFTALPFPIRAQAFGLIPSASETYAAHTQALVMDTIANPASVVPPRMLQSHDDENAPALRAPPTQNTS